ncbi:hypothetical protein [Alicyclobacillus mengziensis]|uniref:Uncharacterized protein n=1 Tax=Alicyclobacillus mengziensis TaxID=2931921 RepID=A0A9X7Z9W1_9BACL|nr:hypothetical protein [Alicyclobacillus mengziensis]QSO50116.1 hypothetical protein JZ786_24685 [Alicyclobacillus mengziensis]
MSKSTSRKTQLPHSQNTRDKRRIFLRLMEILAKLRQEHRRKIFGRRKRYNAIRELQPLVSELQKSRLEYRATSIKSVKTPNILPTRERVQGDDMER